VTRATLHRHPTVAALTFLHFEIHQNQACLGVQKTEHNPTVILLQQKPKRIAQPPSHAISRISSFDVIAAEALGHEQQGVLHSTQLVSA
jgi:hypothetical protein